MSNMCRNLFVRLLLVAIVTLVKAHDEECERKLDELAEKRGALKEICNGTVSYEQCCVELEEKVNEREAILMAECTACSQSSIVFPKGEKDTAGSAISSGSYMKLTAVTTCLWVKASPPKWKSCLVSYVVPGYVNELMLYAGNDKVYFMIRNNVQTDYSAEVNIMDNQWHAVCATWTHRPGGLYKIFVDGKERARGWIEYPRLFAKGTWSLGRAQAVAGTFNAEMDLAGEITNANVWSRVLSRQEIEEYSASCEWPGQGDVKSWGDFLTGVRGNLVVKTGSSCCEKAK